MMPASSHMIVDLIFQGILVIFFHKTILAVIRIPNSYFPWHNCQKTKRTEPEDPRGHCLKMNCFRG